MKCSKIASLKYRTYFIYKNCFIIHTWVIFMIMFYTQPKWKKTIIKENCHFLFICLFACFIFLFLFDDLNYLNDLFGFILFSLKLVNFAHGKQNRFWSNYSINILRKLKEHVIYFIDREIRYLKIFKLFQIFKLLDIQKQTIYWNKIKFHKCPFKNIFITLFRKEYMSFVIF